MSYNSRTIGAVVDDVNRSYLLPAIQRPFVWSSSQVIALFDSLLKGYPISSFMFWAVDEATRAEVRCHRFLENYHPEKMNEPTNPVGQQVVLVLDGQQRLTSLVLGLRGTFSEKAKGARKTNAAAWSAKTLWIDLIKDPREDDDEEDGGESDLGVTYRLAFHDRKPSNSHKRHWFKLGAMLDYESDDRLEALVAKVKSELHHGVTSYERRRQKKPFVSCTG